jgi:hypothetical protein
MIYLSSLELDMHVVSDTPNSTLSKMTINNEFFCFIIEDGARIQKVMGKTRIPGGRYKIRKRTFGRFYELYNRRYNHLFVPELLDVPNFTNILIHIGNTVENTDGCLLPNMGAILDREVFRGMQSAVAYLRLYKLMSEYSQINLNIYR